VLEASEKSQLNKVIIAKYELRDDSRLYGSNSVSLGTNSAPKLSYENNLPKTVVAAIYDSTATQLAEFTDAEIAAQLEKLNKKYFKEYDLPDHYRAKVLKGDSCDAVVEVYARLKGGGSASGSGYRIKSPKLILKGRMYNANNELIWRKKIKLKGKKLPGGQLGIGALSLSYTKGMSMGEVQALFDAGFVQLFSLEALEE